MGDPSGFLMYLWAMSLLILSTSSLSGVRIALSIIYLALASQFCMLFKLPYIASSNAIFSSPGLHPTQCYDDGIIWKNCKEVSGTGATARVMVFFCSSVLQHTKLHFCVCPSPRKYKFPRGKVPRVSRSGAERERERERETDIEILIVRICQDS